MKTIASILSFILLIPYSNLFSQTVSFTLPQIALLDVEPTGDIPLNFSVPTEAGRPINNPTPNTTKWLNYTSAVASGGTRSITAAISQTIPGIDIKLQAGTAAGGGGTLGTPAASQITLSTMPRTIISGIGGAYTGNGAGNGHQLTFSASPSDYAALVAASNTVTVTYTITDDGASAPTDTYVSVNNYANAITIPAITEAGNDYGAATPNGNPITLGPYTIGSTLIALLTTVNIPVYMSYTPHTWNNALHLYANRNGGTSSFSGGVLYVGTTSYTDVGGSYPEITQTSKTFFNLTYSFTAAVVAPSITYSNILVSVQLGGVSVTIPAGDYNADITFSR